MVWLVCSWVLLATACDAVADHATGQLEYAHAVASASTDYPGADTGGAGPDADADAATATGEDTAVTTLDDASTTGPEDTATAPDTTAIEDTATTTTDTGTADTAADASEPGSCGIGAVVGACRPVGTCAAGEVGIEQLCPGSPQVRCCLQALDRCSSAGVPGACLDIADCPSPGWTVTSGLCPGGSTIKCCTETGRTNSCDEALRPTPNDGFVTEAPGDPGCPAGMAAVAGFCIDRYEASLVLASDPGKSVTPYYNPGALAVRAVSVEWSVPQGYIDEVRAKAACVAAGKRLCTTTEWLRACQGEAGNTYPYGSEREPGVCNDDRRAHVAVEYFGTSDAWIYSQIGNQCLDQLPSSLDLAGENPGCVTAEGVFDLMGNLHEWVDDDAGTFRGGFFDDTTINGNGCLYRTTAHDVHHSDYSTGFRCCADRE